MSNSGDAPGRKSGSADAHDDVLAALHGLGDDSHEEHHDEVPPVGAGAESREDAGASSAASGFVGMLAKQGSADPGGSAAPISDTPAKSRRDLIPMAREVDPSEQPMFARASEPARGPTRRPVKKAPGWYHAAVPVMYTLGSMLILIGLWAVGALIYMAVKTPAAPEEVGYPLIAWAWENEDHVAGAFTQGSKLMSAAMLVCLPVSFAPGIMAAMMQKQIRASDRAEGR